MAAIKLIRGTGSFFKTGGNPESRWPQCPHDYTIRYRNAGVGLYGDRCISR